MKTILLFPETAEGGENSEPKTQNSESASGPAATAVIEGGKTERELHLEQQLEAEKSARKKAEDERGAFEVEITRLKNPPAPAPKEDDESETQNSALKTENSRGIPTFLDDDDE